MTQAGFSPQPEASGMDMEAAFLSGSQRALQELIDAYGHALLRYCHGILCDYHEAQDAVQLTFIKAYSRRSRYQPGTNLRAWLYRIAYTTCMDLLRSKRLREAFSIALPARQEPDAGISPELRSALSTLSPADRALLWSRAVEETPYEILERVHHVPAATLRKRYERAKRKLADRLSASEAELGGFK